MSMGSPLRAGVRGLGFAGAAAGRAGWGALGLPLAFFLFLCGSSAEFSAWNLASMEVWTFLLVPRALGYCPSTPGGLGGGFRRFDDFPLAPRLLDARLCRYRGAGSQLELRNDVV